MVERIKTEDSRKKLNFEEKYDEGLKEITEELKKRIKGEEGELEFFNSFMKKPLGLKLQEKRFDYYKQLNEYMEKKGVEKTFEMLTKIYDETDLLKEELSRKIDENNIGIENRYVDMYHNPLTTKMAELLIPIRIIQGGENRRSYEIVLKGFKNKNAEKFIRKISK